MCSDFVLDDPVTCIENERRYMVVDCGGGTVDITVHEMSKEGGKLKELFKATGGPFGSTTVDEAFKVCKTEKGILITIIPINLFIKKELMINFAQNLFHILGNSRRNIWS